MKILAASMLFGVTALATTPGKPLEIGPYVVGMNFDEARAATPSLVWRNSLMSKYTGKVVSIVAPDGITLGGLSHAVELQPGYYGAYAITFKHMQSVADPVACERLTVNVVADLEGHFGTFEPRLEPAPPMTAKAGKQSTVGFSTDEDAGKVARTANPHWRLGTAEHVEGENRIRLESIYNRDDYTTPFCKILTQISFDPPAPPWETLKFEPSLWMRQPSTAIKHMTLDAVQLPASTVEVDLVCGVDRHSGVLACAKKTGAQVSDEVRQAAIRRTLAMRVSTAGLDPDNPLSVLMDLKVTLLQSERHAIDFLSTPRVQMSDLVWTEQPSVEDLEAAYPKSMLEAGVSAKMGVTCQVQTDLSVLCTPTDPEPKADAKAIEDHTKLAWASVAVMSLYKAAPALKSGGSAAGAVFDTRVAFRPID